MTRIAIIALVAALLGSCDPVDVYRVSTTKYAPLPSDADVAVHNTNPVGKPFEVIANISYHELDLFRGRCPRLDDAVEPLKAKARGIGANGIIIDKTVIGSKPPSCTGMDVHARAIRINGS